MYGAYWPEASGITVVPGPSEVERLREENARLRAALAIFADGNRWGDDGTCTFQFYSQGEPPDVMAQRALRGEAPE